MRPVNEHLIATEATGYRNPEDIAAWPCEDGCGQIIRSNHHGMTRCHRARTRTFEAKEAEAMTTTDQARGGYPPNGSTDPRLITLRPTPFLCTTTEPVDVLTIETDAIRNHCGETDDEREYEEAGVIPADMYIGHFGVSSVYDGGRVSIHVERQAID